MKIRSWFKAMLVTAVVIGYPVAMHMLLTSGQWPAATLVMALLPFGLLPLSLLAAGRIVWGLAATGGLLGAASYGWHTLLQRQDLIYLLQNLGMQCLMALVFGHTLRAGYEPLISQFARRVHRSDYNPAIAAYTRQATWAWTLFFIVMGLGSLLLFAAAPLAVWSWFVNFASFVLLGLMFAGEYAVRRWRLRDVRHVPFLRSLTLYWDKQAPVDGQAGKP